MSKAENIIEIKQLDFSYKRGHKILDNLNLNIPSGSIFAFVGENGAGKTSTLKSIVGLNQPKRGNVQVFGKELRQNRLDVLTRIGLLIEMPTIYYHLTGLQNLKIWCKLRKISIDVISTIIDEVGLSKFIHNKCNTYSMGMKQRLGIAIALLHNPDVLILDEPTNGLDPMGRIHLRQLLKRLHEAGKTIIVSSHLLSEIEMIATHIGIIKNGQILFQGSIQALKEIQRDSNKVFFEVENPQKAISALQSHFNNIVLKDNTTISITAIERSDIPKIVKTLCADNIGIYSIREEHKNLEQLFIHSLNQ